MVEVEVVVGGSCLRALRRDCLHPYSMRVFVARARVYIYSLCEKGGRQKRLSPFLIRVETCFSQKQTKKGEEKKA